MTMGLPEPRKTSVIYPGNQCPSVSRNEWFVNG